MPTPLRLVLAAAALLLAAPAARAQLPGSAAADSITLRPGDAVRVMVWRQPELSGEFTIGPDGSVMHPLYRELRVTGATLPVLDQRMRAILSRYGNSPEFVIQPLFRVAVGGNVRLPNLYTFPPGTTVAQAIATAGGPSERGRLRKVKLVRDGRERMLDLTQPTVEMAEMPVRSGDQILVGRYTDILREYIGPISSLVAAAAMLVQVTTNDN
jgi:polysaccharide export outer membrane protein